MTQDQIWRSLCFEYYQSARSRMRMSTLAFRARRRQHSVYDHQNADVYPTELWTVKRVAEVIEKHFGVRYNPSGVLFQISA